MNNDEYNELKLRTIVPQAERWPDDLVHWQRMKEVVVEARDRVAKACEQIDVIERNSDLSPEGKKRQCRKVATEAITDFESSKALLKARSAVDHVVAMWADKVGLTVKAASNIHEATVHAQIRDRLAAMTTSRLGFLEKHASDPCVASAILTAPIFLSGLSDPELALVKHKVEQHLGPEIADAKAATLKAFEQAEDGWQLAIDKIGERAGLTKGSDGTWGDPSISEAA